MTNAAAGGARRRPLAIGDIFAALARVLTGGRKLGGVAVLAGVKQSLEERPAPATAGTSTEAFGQLPNATRLLDANEVDNLPLGDMKTEAKLVVEFHSRSLLFTAVARQPGVDSGI